MVRRNQDEFNAREKYPVKVTGVVFSNPIISSLSVAEAGVFLVMADYFIQHALQSMQDVEVVEMLTLHSCSEEAARKEIKHLKIRGLVDITAAGRLSIPSVTKAFEFAVQEANRRKSGWDKRRNSDSLGSDPGVQAQDGLGEVVSEGSQLTHGGKDALPDSEQPKSKAKKKRVTQVGDFVLVSAGDDDASEIVAELICDDGKIAKVTKGYAISNEKLYPGVDTVRQLALMEVWCKDNPSKRKTSRRIRTFIGNWFNNQLNQVHIRNAVTAATRPQSQFGQGGEYSTPVTDAALPPANDGLDEFRV